MLKFYLGVRDIARLRLNLHIYEEACRLVKAFTWHVPAAMHKRESDLASSSLVPGDLMGCDPGGEGDVLRENLKKLVYSRQVKYGIPLSDIDTDLFTAVVIALDELKNDYHGRPIVAGNGQLDRLSLGESLMNYNGRARYYNPKGQGMDGGDQPNPAASPYVANDPLNGSPLKLHATQPMKDGTRVTTDFFDQRPGVLVLYDEITMREGEIRG